VGANAQYWPKPEAAGRWIHFRSIFGNPNGSSAWEITGGVSDVELNERGLATIGSGQPDYGYFSFSGELD
jgi:hypothetical protein